MEQYFVEFSGGDWKVRYEGSYVGAFPSQTAATHWAIDRAHNAEARSVRALVLIQDEQGGFRTHWWNRLDPAA
jgi:hypothetical protein